MALTLLWNKSAVFTLRAILGSECTAGPSPLTVSLLYTILTPGKSPTVSWASALWEVSETVPVRVATPFLHSGLMASFLR